MKLSHIDVRDTETEIKEVVTAYSNTASRVQNLGKREIRKSDV